MPPFGRLAGIILSGAKQDVLQDFVRRVARALPVTDKATVFGPAPAPLALVRGRHRVRFLVKAGRDFNIQGFIHAWLDELQVPGSVACISGSMRSATCRRSSSSSP